MKTGEAHVGCGFYLGWILANTLGVAVPLAIIGTLLGLAEVSRSRAGSALMDLAFTLLPLLGLVPAAVQWIPLRGRVSQVKAIRWIGVSGVGYIVAGASTFVLVGVALFFVTIATAGHMPSAQQDLLFVGLLGWSGAQIGAMVGIAQWVFIFRNRFRRAGLWVGASTLGGAMGSFVGMGLTWIIFSIGFPSLQTRVAALAQSGASAAASLILMAVTWGACIGLVSAIVTGISLVYLLNHPIGTAQATSP